MRQPEIVESERRGLGHQQDGVGVEANGHGGTAYAGGRIDEGVGGDRREHQIQFFTQGAQERRGHGFPDAGAPHEEAAPAFQHGPLIQHAEFAAAGRKGLGGANGETAAAAVAHVRKDREARSELGDGLVAADGAAGSAQGAALGIEDGDFQSDGFRGFHGGGQEQVQVRGLHVRVHGDEGAVPDRRERRRNRGLARAALAAGDGDTHGGPTCWARRRRARPRFCIFPRPHGRSCRPDPDKP